MVVPVKDPDTFNDDKSVVLFANVVKPETCDKLKKINPISNKKSPSYI
jgi:hypothetical protein